MSNFYDMVWWEYIVYAGLIAQLIWLPLQLKAMYASLHCIKRSRQDYRKFERDIAGTELWLFAIIIAGLILMFNP